MKLYYLIWVDCIQRIQAQPANKRNWRLLSMIFMTVPMSIDFIFIMTVLQEYIIGHYFYKLDIVFLPDEINRVVSFLILFIAPSIVINHFLIFMDSRYEKLIKKYKYHNGTLFITFLAVSIFCPIIILWFGILSRE
jgi:hypothetical protein